jgi:osmotically-inducible protein OsmY
VTAGSDEPATYLIGRIQDALATDPRCSELGVDVTVDGRRVVLAGTVATEALRRAVAQVVAEQAPRHEVVDDLAVVSGDEGGPVEELA